MSNHSKIDSLDTVDNPQATPSNITGTTVDNKRLLDVNPMGYGPASATPKTKRIFNLSITAADIEQSLTLPTRICGYMIRTRGGGILRLTHVSGESGIIYLEIPRRSVHMDEHVFENLTLYFQSPTAGEVVEIVTWE